MESESDTDLPEVVNEADYNTNIVQCSRVEEDIEVEEEEDEVEDDDEGEEEDEEGDEAEEGEDGEDEDEEGGDEDEEAGDEDEDGEEEDDEEGEGDEDEEEEGDEDENGNGEADDDGEGDDADEGGDEVQDEQGDEVDEEGGEDDEEEDEVEEEGGDEEEDEGEEDEEDGGEDGDEGEVDEDGGEVDEEEGDEEEDGDGVGEDDEEDGGEDEEEVTDDSDDDNCVDKAAPVAKRTVGVQTMDIPGLKFHEDTRRLLAQIAALPESVTQQNNTVPQSKPVAYVAPKRPIPRNDRNETKRLKTEPQPATSSQQQKQQPQQQQQQQRSFVSVKRPASPDSDSSSEAELVQVFRVLKISWNDMLHNFVVPKKTKFSKIRMELAQRVGNRPDNIAIVDGNDEVPDSKMALSVPHDKIFETQERPNINIHAGTAWKAEDLKDDFLLIRLQTRGLYRDRYSFAMRKGTYFRQLVYDYKMRIGFPTKNYKLMLDGEHVDLDKTPEALNLGHNDMLDIIELQ